MTNAFRYRLARAVHAGSMTAQPRGEQAPFGAVLRAVEQGFPGHRIERATFPRAGDDVYVFRLRQRQGAKLDIATVDPYSASVLRAGSVLAFPVEAALFLHANLLSGETGEHVVGALGACLFALCVSGIVLWWPRPGALRRAITIRPGAPRARLVLDLHQVPGICAVLCMAHLALTGALMSARTSLRPLLARFVPVVETVLPVPPPARGDDPQPSTESQLASARIRFPGERIRDLRFRGEGERIMGVLFFADGHPQPRALDQVWLDRRSGAVLAVVDSRLEPAGNQIVNWLLPLHTGEALGLPGRLAVFATGATVLLSALTGPWLWLERRAARKRAEARARRPAPEAASSAA
jgi:uncharacterized iron-regulated membrane protein